MDNLLTRIRSCTLCRDQLPLTPKPILQASQQSRILIVGQAPGIVTHQKGIPFDDKSGDRLRSWLGVNRAQFYDPSLFAIIPMSFCYPGKGRSGDNPPIPLCAETWRVELLNKLTHVQLTIILGKYAIDWHLHTKAPITELARQWQTFLKSDRIVLPHPSPRNNIWLKKNAWFEEDVIPKLQDQINHILFDHL
ncbi:uracil-DNA glycosylase family protein [Thalassotalea piscium]